MTISSNGGLDPDPGANKLASDLPMGEQPADQNALVAATLRKIVDPLDGPANVGKDLSAVARAIVSQVRSAQDLWLGLGLFQTKLWREFLPRKGAAFLGRAGKEWISLYDRSDADFESSLMRIFFALTDDMAEDGRRLKVKICHSDSRTVVFDEHAWTLFHVYAIDPQNHRQRAH